jgi:hypothetical protein
MVALEREMQTAKQAPPNDQWCVSCTPDPDMAPGNPCCGCGVQSDCS